MTVSTGPEDAEPSADSAPTPRTPNQSGRKTVTPNKFSASYETISQTRPISARSADRPLAKGVYENAEKLLRLTSDTIREVSKIGITLQPDHQPYAIEMVKLADDVNSLSSVLRMSDSVVASDSTLDLIRTASSKVAKQFGRTLKVYSDAVVPTYSAPVREQAETLVRLARERLQTQELVEETRAARDAAVVASKSARAAAGETGSSSLAGHFATFAKEERRRADRLRLAAGSLLIAISSLAGFVLFTSTFDNESVVHDVAKIAVTLPIAVLAAYLGRESSRHRAAALWAKTLEIQLMTLDAFVAPLASDEQQRQRAELGRRVFGTVEKTEAVPENSPALVTETAALLASVANLLKPAEKDADKG